MGCAASQDATAAPPAGSPPVAQAQSAEDKAKDAAAAEIQAAAKTFKEKKDAEESEKRKDEAAAEIQGGAAAYLAKKREEKKKAEEAAKAAEPSVLDNIIGFFSGRAPGAPTGVPEATKAEVIDNYSSSNIAAGVTAGVEKIGKTMETMTIADMAPVDEFHVGGRPATIYNIEKIGGLQASDVVLDVGCGTGGTCRFLSTQAARVTGVDLTPAFIDAGNDFNSKMKVENVELKVGDATNLGPAVASETFDKVFLQHVGMNIPDKVPLAKSVAATLKAGGKLVVYDFMKMGGDMAALTFPVPWASAGSHSFIASPDEYKSAFAGAGLTLVSEESRKDFAISFINNMKEMMKKAKAETGEMPPLGLPLYFSPGTAPARINNTLAAVEADAVAPVVMVFQK